MIQAIITIPPHIHLSQSIYSSASMLDEDSSDALSHVPGTKLSIVPFYESRFGV